MSILRFDLISPTDALAICLLVDLCATCSDVNVAVHIICNGSPTRNVDSPQQQSGSHTEVWDGDYFSAINTKLPFEEIM